MTIQPDAWLASRMARPAFRLDGVTGIEAADIVAATAAPGFYYGKVDTADVAASRALSAAGFYVADVNITLESTPALVQRRRTPPDRRVEPVTASSSAAVLDIAGSCFRYNRFHRDPAVPRAVADAIKRDWIQSYVDGTRGDCLLVAFDDGRPAGFLAALVANTAAGCVATIDLVGVASDRQQRGIGADLVLAFAAHYASAGRLRVGTQAANLPSLKLYERLGFEIAQTTYVFHRHTS